MTSLILRTRRWAAAVTTALLAAACVNTFYRTESVDVKRPEGANQSVIRSPVKAHLLDGSTVIFRGGAAITSTEIFGIGISYPLLSTDGVSRDRVPLDSVVGVETFEQQMLIVQSVVASLGATALGALGTAVLAVAIFGSCPTVYADSAGTPVLQAEGFSYAIAPLLEHRDVDGLRLSPGQDGDVRLELRNEALETHFINHIELLAARHPRGTRVVPDQSGRPVIVGTLRPITHAVDRAGRDVRSLLAEPDGQLFASAPSVIDAARVGDLDDWLRLEVNDLPAGDSIAVVLRLRNSLLNTVLLYEGVLGGRDAPDWLGREMQKIGVVTELARWYVSTMGLRAYVGDPGATPGLPDARLGDVGPIAFRDVALVLPRPDPNTTAAQVTLRFVADNWRIDHVAIAARVMRPEISASPAITVRVDEPARGEGPVHDSSATVAIADADDRYLETRPGQRMQLVFSPAQPRAGADTTISWLIAWQGWYREWIRGQWLAEPKRTTPFIPGDSAVLTALRQWRARQPDFEKQFYSTRIPVR